MKRLLVNQEREKGNYENALALLACEFGYKANEKGLTLAQALRECLKTLEAGDKS